MSAFRTEIDREALDWLVQVNDPAFDGWEAWEAWMADPARAAVYWRLAEDEADAVEALGHGPSRSARTVKARPALPLSRRTALAAVFALVALGGAAFVWNDRFRPVVIQTGPGEVRAVTLADGSQIALAGGTRLRLDRPGSRAVTLEAGRALFEVVHDANAPFTVVVGDAVLTDLGTTFDVTRLAGGARVSVSEGIVQVDQGAATATLNPGDSVLATDDGLERRAVAPEDVDSWRRGRMSWTGEPLTIVAEDLARILNRPITVAPAVADRRFTGSLSLSTDPVEQRRRLERLLGVTITETGDGWRLEP